MTNEDTLKQLEQLAALVDKLQETTGISYNLIRYPYLSESNRYCIERVRSHTIIRGWGETPKQAFAALRREQHIQQRTDAITARVEAFRQQLESEPQL